jgi:hypothetical protein
MSKSFLELCRKPTVQITAQSENVFILGSKGLKCQCGLNIHQRGHITHEYCIVPKPKNDKKYY